MPGSLLALDELVKRAQAHVARARELLDETFNDLDRSSQLGLTIPGRPGRPLRELGEQLDALAAVLGPQPHGSPAIAVDRDSDTRQPLSHVAGSDQGGAIRAASERSGR